MITKSLKESLLALVLVSASVAAADIDPSIRGLMTDLQSDNPAAKAVARQTLPNHGLVVVPAMIPLLSGNDATVSKASYDILLQVSNDVSAPGREKDRKRMTDLLMPLVNPDRAENVRILGLRLLERLVPPGYDVAPIAAMLSEPPLREKARTALQRIGTEGAHAALQSGLSDADPVFQVAILRSLGELEDGESLEMILRLAVTGVPEVQVAAIRALAWTGDPSYLAIAKSARDNAQGKLKDEATEAMLLLAERIAKKGGNWEIAVRTYEEIAKSSEGALKDAALVALGKHGDERYVPLLVGAIEYAEPEKSGVVLQALRNMEGPAVTKRLVAMLPEMATATQIILKPVIEARGAGTPEPK